jgi:kinesin family protein 11
VFGPDSNQEKVYSQAIVPIVQEVLDGFNCTIFAYGQTGTGKTFTMEGGPRNSSDGKRLSAEAGVIPRAIKQIFDAIESNDVRTAAGAGGLGGRLRRRAGGRGGGL